MLSTVSGSEDMMVHIIVRIGDTPVSCQLPHSVTNMKMG